MPEKIKNILKFNVDDFKLYVILDDIKNNHFGLGSLDFNKLIPMPQELNIEKSHNTQEGSKLYLEYMNRAAEVVKELKNPDITGEQFEKATLEQKKLLEEIDSLEGEDKYIFDLGKQYNDNLSKYGYGDWYDWRADNWNTMWNAYNASFHDKMLTFETALNPPEPIIRAISERYPDVEIHHAWASESIGKSVGEREYIGGDVVFQNIPDEYSKEAYDMSCEVWEHTPEYFGLKLNEEIANEGFNLERYYENDEEIEI